MKRLRPVLLAACLSLSPAAFAAKPVPLPGPLDPLPLAAQQALDAGIAFARTGDLDRALESLVVAGRLAPTSALVFFNRGIVEGRMSGRELRAVAWLAAALSAAPDAAMAPAARKEIVRLRDQSRRAHLDLIRIVADAARLAPYPHYRARAQSALSDAIAHSGDSVGARAVLDDINEPDDKARALLVLATYLQTVGNAARARSAFAEAAALLESNVHLNDLPGTLTREWLAVGTAHTNAGNRENARAALEAAITSANRIDDGGNRGEILVLVGDALARNGDDATALAIANGFGVAYVQGQIMVSLAGAQARRGDLATARATATAAPLRWKSTAQNAIAEAQIAAGDLAGSRETLLTSVRLANEEAHAYDRCSQLSRAFVLQAAAGDLPAARATHALARKAEAKTGKDRSLARGVVSRSAVALDPPPVGDAWMKDLYNGPLSWGLFSDPKERLDAAKTKSADPNAYLSELLKIIEEITKERDEIDMRLAAQLNL